jgi:rhodanese-related sulfurtransferase
MRKMTDINEIKPTDLEQMMDNDKNLVVIDVREDEEVAQGMINGATHIPLQTIPEEKDKLEKDKHYVFVCRSGGRSMKAATYMHDQGFNVSNMTGGMLNWKGEVVS